MPTDHIKVRRQIPSRIGEKATHSPVCDPAAMQSRLTFNVGRKQAFYKKEQNMRFTRRLFVCCGALAAPFVIGRAASASEDTQGPVPTTSRLSAPTSGRITSMIWGSDHHLRHDSQVLQHGRATVRCISTDFRPAFGRVDPPGLYRGRREAGEPELGADAIYAGTQPGMARLRAWRRPDQPARHPCPLPVVAILPHPWLHTIRARSVAARRTAASGSTTNISRRSFRPDAGRDASEADLAR